MSNWVSIETALKFWLGIQYDDSYMQIYNKMKEIKCKTIFAHMGRDGSSTCLSANIDFATDKVDINKLYNFSSATKPFTRRIGDVILASNVSSYTNDDGVEGVSWDGFDWTDGKTIMAETEDGIPVGLLMTWKHTVHVIDLVGYTLEEDRIKKERVDCSDCGVKFFVLYEQKKENVRFVCCSCKATVDMESSYSLKIKR